MRKMYIAGALALTLAVGGIGCTNMNKTQQGALSGTAIGAAAGAGIAAIAGGYAGWGALAGAGLGALAGGIVGNEMDKKDNRYR